MPKEYTDLQINLILQKIIAKARYELLLAQEHGNVDDVISDYGIQFEENPMPVNPRQSKIYVIGHLSGKKNDYIMSAKKLGINEENIEFVSDYDRLTNMNLSKLEYSNTYSDIIFGPIPHSMAGKGDVSSIVVKMENSPEMYPRVIRAIANNDLKLSISSFRKSLRETRYFESMI